MRKSILRYGGLNKLMLFLLCFACGSESEVDEFVSPDLMHPGPWTAAGYTQLTHDGSPHETERFVSYTNFSPDEIKVETALYADTVIEEILQVFDVTWDDYDFVSSQPDGKIVILSDYDQRTQPGGLAFWNGIIIRSLKSPLYYQNYTHYRWRRTMKHELVHVNEQLLIGTLDNRQSNTVWFREGIANYISENQNIFQITQIDQWRERLQNVLGQGNPIKIKVWADFPNSNVQTWEYYDFFELGIRYLLDSDGNNSTIESVKSYYEDLGNGISAEDAFESNFGMTHQYFEDNYWDIMIEYLSH